MFIELHILQNFAPSNLNRDDTGSPKDCVFGGFRRARISSQCLKRAARSYFKQARLVPEENLAVRTKRIVEEVASQLAQKERDKELAAGVVQLALAGVELTVKEDGKTQYLLYLGSLEIARFVDLCESHWDELAEIVKSQTEEAGGDDAKPKKKGAKKKKKAAKDLVPDTVRKEMKDLFGAPKAADLALFGRMLADMVDKNIDAACQVAHAISTNEVSMEIDFYTAVDDLKPDDTQGADMIGVVEFNSSCFYRYALVDVGKLVKNLQQDRDLARQTALAFIKASVEAVPTGKQNSMAAHNPPHYVRVAVREGGMAWNMANAFTKPVRPPRGAERSLTELSVDAIEVYQTQLERMYGADGFLENVCSVLHDKDSPSMPALFEAVGAAIDGGTTGAT